MARSRTIRRACSINGILEFPEVDSDTVGLSKLSRPAFLARDPIKLFRRSCSRSCAAIICSNKEICDIMLELYAEIESLQVNRFSFGIDAN